MLLMFNNNIYTDFRTAYEHILLIPNYVIRVIYQNQIITKLNIDFLAEIGQDQHLKLNP